MKCCFCIVVLSIVGCGKAEMPAPAPPPVLPTPAPVAVIPPPVAKPAEPKLRPRFREGMETFLTEARVIVNLPSTGASLANVTEQQKKVQQAFARVSEPQTPLEKSVHAKAKQFTVDTWGIVNSLEVHQDLLVSGITNGRQDIDDTAKFLKDELKPIEDALDE